MNIFRCMKRKEQIIQNSRKTYKLNTCDVVDDILQNRKRKKKPNYNNKN